MQLDRAQLEFLARFAKAPEGRMLVELLQAKLRERDSKLRTLIGEEVFRAQGRALELAELIEQINGAQQTLNHSNPTSTSRLRTLV